MAKRMEGKRLTQPIRSTLELVDCNRYPIGALFALWHGSRHDRMLKARDVEMIYKRELWHEGLNEIADYICDCYPEYAEGGARNVIENIVRLVIKSNVPAAEGFNMIFSIDNATVALREQMVRSKFASYWTQTSRTADLTTMDVHMSEAVVKAGDEAVDTYKNAVDTVRKAYETLVALGVPVEEIRLSPESRTHRVYWMIDIRSLIGIVAKRACWIAQAGLWSPVIQDLITELREVDPLFSNILGAPPCSVKKEYCNYDIENEDRYEGRDPIPVCPLWFKFKYKETLESVQPFFQDKHKQDFYETMQKQFGSIWSDEYLEYLEWER